MEEYERMMKEESIEVAEIFDEMHKETPNEMKWLFSFFVLIDIYSQVINFAIGLVMVH